MKVESNTEVDTREHHAGGDAGRDNRPRHRWLVIVLVVLAVAVVLVSGVLPRIQARANLRKETLALATPAVSITHPQRSAPAQELVLPANVQAFIDAPIYARTNGYLKKWYVDIGTRVKSGQLLAEIDTPEINQQLRQARADLSTAEANLHLAEITATRYKDLLKTDSVSKQDADNAEGDYQAKQAVVHSAQANVKRLEELQSFEKVYAPFAGVISARNTDIGALIDAGAAGGRRTELFHIVQPGVLRAYVNVPEAYSQAAKPGLTADLTFAEHPGKRFEGKLVRTADAIDAASRTLLVEIDVNNPTGNLLPGAYAEVHLKLPAATGALVIPVNTLLFRSEGLRVATVANGHAQLKQVTLGHDFGSSVEVVAGLNDDDAIIVNPPDSLVSGEAVRVIAAPAEVQQ